MISHDLKCIFIHPNRNGGKSIELAIWGVNPSIGSADHRRIYDWQRKLGEKVFQSYFKFVFCRNPWDRMVSLYSYYKQVSRKGRKGICLSDLKSFGTFVRAINPYDSCSPVPIQISWIKGMDGKPCIDFIGRMENYEEDWLFICKKLGINRCLPHINKSRHDDYWKYYDRYLGKRVGELYKEDIEFFGYSFGGVK